MMRIGHLPLLKLAVGCIGLLWLSLAATPGWAGSLTVKIVDKKGQPVRNAVVTLKARGTAAPSSRAGANYQVRQKDTQFHPFVSVVPVGATVAFPNLDPFRHHVYSFSPAKRFDLKLIAEDQSRSVTFDTPGVVAIGCNIHDRMSAYIFVADTPFAAQTGASGTVTFRNAPDTAFSLQVWHPYLRAPGGSLAKAMPASSANRSQTITVRLRPPPMHRMDGY